MSQPEALSMNLSPMPHQVISCGYDGTMETNTIITKTATGYTYNGVNIKRTIIKNKPVFSFEIDMAGIVIDSQFKTLKAATQRIDASVAKRSGMFGTAATTHVVANGRLALN
jgi:hypothetical protein